MQERRGRGEGVKGLFCYQNKCPYNINNKSRRHKICPELTASRVQEIRKVSGL